MRTKCCECYNAPNHLIGKEEWKKIQRRMLPGEFSKMGFINEGESLAKIIDNDRNILEKTGITYEQIADQLESVLNMDYDKNKYKILIESYMGTQECPFRSESEKCTCEENKGSNDITVVDKKTRKSIRYSSLAPHMIRCHKFFESPTVSYRVDPIEIIEFFNLKPSLKYNAVQKRYYYWEQNKCLQNINESDINNLKYILLNLSVATYKFNNINIYLVPTNESLETYIPEINHDKKYSYEKLRTLVHNLKTKDQESSLVSKLNQKDIKRHNTLQKQLFHQDLKNELTLYNLYKKYKILVDPNTNLSLQAFVVLDNITDDITDNITNDVSDDINNDITNDATDDITNNATDDISDYVSDDVTDDNIYDNSPNYITHNKSHNINNDLVYNIENIPLNINSMCVVQNFKLHEYKYYPI